MSGAESSRFTHLLQPIRDLSKNWNIDLAQELEEYLDELEHLNIAFDPQDDAAALRSGVAASTRLAQASLSASQGDGARVMNFAEAALLIQGTSVIYSRKVEYLYALVFQTLAHLTKQSDAPQRSSSANAGAHGDSGDAPAHDGDDDSDAYDVFLNPLPMVDDLDEARNITLKSNSIESQRQRHAVKSNTNIQASISLMGSLIPDERDHGETFKLLSCTLHASGVLLLDETSKKYLGADANRGDNDSDVQWNGQRTASQYSDPVAALNFDDVTDDFFMDGGGGNDTDDDDNGNDDGGGAGPEDNYGDADFGYNDDNGTAPEELDEDGDAARQVSFTPTASEEAPAPRARRRDEHDPWAPLDPYDASNATSRPFRKGRSYPKPKKTKTKKKSDDNDQVDGLDDPQFKERFFYGATRPQWTSWVWSETNESALERKFKKKFCKAPLLVKSCDELWKLETKWRSLVRRRAAKDEQSAQAMLLQEQAEEEEEQMHALGGITMANGVSALDLDLNAANDDDDDDDVDDGGAPDDDYDDSGGAAFDTGDWDAHYDKNDRDNDNGAPMSSRYLDPTLPTGNDTASSGPMSYEDICRQHIQSFMRGTEKYVRETNLSKQVNDWQSKLTPILKEQDAHPPFDIHTYGRDIIGHLAHETKVKAEEQQQLTPKRKAAAITADDDDADVDVDSAAPISFGEIVGGMSQYQVCRMFLASLQLANNGNVHLVHGHSAAEQSHVPFQMKLLSTSNVYESLQQQTQQSVDSRSM